MEQYFDIHELLVILDCIDFVIEDLDLKAQPLPAFGSSDKYTYLNAFLLSKIEALRSKVRDGVLLIDPEFELPY